jgi:hypothetical protein
MPDVGGRRAAGSGATRSRAASSASSVDLAASSVDLSGQVDLSGPSGSPGTCPAPRPGAQRARARLGARRPPCCAGHVAARRDAGWGGVGRARAGTTEPLAESITRSLWPRCRPAAACDMSPVPTANACCRKLCGVVPAMPWKTHGAMPGGTLPPAPSSSSPDARRGHVRLLCPRSPQIEQVLRTPSLSFEIPCQRPTPVVTSLQSSSPRCKLYKARAQICAGENLFPGWILGASPLSPWSHSLVEKRQ